MLQTQTLLKMKVLRMLQLVLQTALLKVLVMLQTALLKVLVMLQLMLQVQAMCFVSCRSVKANTDIEHHTLHGAALASAADAGETSAWWWSQWMAS